MLVPYYLDCRQALEQEGQGYGGGEQVLEAVQSAVQQCASTQVYRCSCAAGYSGDTCEVRFFVVLPPPVSLSRLFLRVLCPCS